MHRDGGNGQVGGVEYLSIDVRHQHVEVNITDHHEAHRQAADQVRLAPCLEDWYKLQVVEHEVRLPLQFGLMP